MIILLLALQLAQLDGPEVVARSIAYHDPDGAWAMLDHTFAIRETRPDGTARHLALTIDHPDGRFVYEGRIDGDEVLKILEGEECRAEVNGSTEIPKELAEKYRTSCEQIGWYRDYYDYLLGMPMKLNDPGTIIGEQVKSTIFNQQRVLQVRVTYDQEVGGDTWYYYFDPRSYRLLGARFYHDEPSNDGELIVFEDEVEIDGMKLPQHRRWYQNHDELYLGMDSLLE